MSCDGCLRCFVGADVSRRFEREPVHLPPELFFFRSAPLSSPNLAKDEGLLAFAPTSCLPALVRLPRFASLSHPLRAALVCASIGNPPLSQGDSLVASRFALQAQGRIRRRDASSRASHAYRAVGREGRRTWHGAFIRHAPRAKHKAFESSMPGARGTPTSTSSSLRPS